MLGSPIVDDIQEQLLTTIIRLYRSQVCVDKHLFLDTQYNN